MYPDISGYIPDVSGYIWMYSGYIWIYPGCIWIYLDISISGCIRIYLDIFGIPRLGGIHIYYAVDDSVYAVLSI
jgi:hypothetical protein